MSRTRISSKMEHNNKLNSLSMLPGSIFNACSFNDDTNATFQFLFNNKSLENEKQQCNGYGVNNISETNNSLLKTLDFIDSNINEYPSVKSETYTLDDLLDLENEELAQVPFYNDNASFDDESLFVPSTEILMDTALASPLSSSSDESCDLDDLLFMCDQAAETRTQEQPASVQEVTDHQYTLLEDAPEADQEISLEDMLAGNTTDLSALCSLLFQAKGIEAPEFSALEEQPTTVLEETTASAPLSPASSVTSSESESESRPARYKPYRKQKTPEQKLRKKAQNRTAATRYRVKKKDELKIMTDEADKLEETNKDLKGKVDGLRNEIDYLKNLMLDVIKARLAKGATPDALLSAAALMLK